MIADIIFVLLALIFTVHMFIMAFRIRDRQRVRAERAANGHPEEKENPWEVFLYVAFGINKS